jgi:hypothetical protein
MYVAEAQSRKERVNISKKLLFNHSLRQMSRFGGVEVLNGKVKWGKSA